MTMKAKFPGRCQACNERFMIGEEIEFLVDRRTNMKTVRHATVNQCSNAKKISRVVQAVPAPVIDLKSISEFLHAAKSRGLNAPKLRVLAPNGRDEVRLSITTKGMEPGSIAVVVAHDFYGCVRTNGSCVGKLAGDDVMQQHLLRVAQDPISAAKEYAALTGLCSFCTKPLTDEGSTEVGYGPICAKKWGLPHTPKGTPTLRNVPVIV